MYIPNFTKSVNGKQCVTDLTLNPKVQGVLYSVSLACKKIKGITYNTSFGFDGHPISIKTVLW